MGTFGLHGILGSTKTWGATLFAILYGVAGYQILSTIELNRDLEEPFFESGIKPFENYINMDTDSIEDASGKEMGLWEYVEKCAVTGEAFPWDSVYLLGDEWQYHSDSRLHAGMENIVRSYLFIQARKRKTIICMTSKTRGLVDNRDRDAEDLTIKCYKKHFFDKKICTDFECEFTHYAEWLKVDINNKVAGTMYFNNLLPIFPFYETRQLNAPITRFDQRETMQIIKQIGDNVGKL